VSLDQVDKLHAKGSTRSTEETENIKHIQTLENICAAFTPFLHKSDYFAVWTANEGHRDNCTV